MGTNGAFHDRVKSDRAAANKAKQEEPAKIWLSRSDILFPVGLMSRKLIARAHLEGLAGYH
jgi:hypothetical protein